eukprot:473913_1
MEYRDVPYETNLLELVRSAYDGWGGLNKEDNLTALFCSEMVAKCYQDMGLLIPASEGGLVCNEYAPRDFTSKICLDLQLGACLEDELWLTRDFREADVGKSCVKEKQSPTVEKNTSWICFCSSGNIED